MRSCVIAFVILSAGFITPTYATADDAMLVIQDLASKWTSAYNNGNAGKVASLYTADATFLSGVLGALKGQVEIEIAINRSIKQAPEITFNPVEAHQNGNIVWGYWDYMFPDGPIGYGAVTVVKDANIWRIVMHIPSPASGCVTISASQPGYMLDGIDWRNPNEWLIGAGKGDCQEFRVWAAIVDSKEDPDGTTQVSPHFRRNPG